MQPDWLQLARQQSASLVAHRRLLHQHPELSFQEYRTAEYIRSVLRELEIPFRTVLETGTIATIGEMPPCVALRCDIDALPIQEQTGLPFASVHEGIMHACGHDMHTAMLLGAAALLKAHQEWLPGTVLLIFQPGEEQLPGGAVQILQQNALAPMLPQMVFGQHVYPEAPVGTVALADGTIFASTDELYWHLRAAGGHAAQPHRSGDPIVAAAELVMHLQTLVSRRRDPLQPAVLSVTAIHGGEATNIIPARVELKGTLRSFAQEWRQWALEQIQQATRAIAQLHGVEAELEVRSGYPPLVNHAQPTALVRSVAQSLLGEHSVLPFAPVMWAEDFAYYSQRFPAAFWMLGVRPPELPTMPGLHHPSFAPSEDALPIGAALLAAVAWTALEWLQNSGSG